MYQLHLLLGQSELTKVVHVWVTSHLDYCNMLCSGQPLKTIQKLIQNATGPFLADTRCNKYITPPSALVAGTFLGTVQGAGVNT